MKKSLLALAVLGAFTGVASAQSSVTVYGKVDLAYGHKAGADINTMSDSGAGSRLGFMGVEDLGGGLKALFRIEHRFNPDDGTTNSSTGKMWHGLSTVGLSHSTYGSINFGRQYTATFSLVQNTVDPFNGDGFAELRSLFLVNDEISYGVDNAKKTATKSNIVAIRNDNSLRYDYAGSALKFAVVVGERANANGTFTNKDSTAPFSAAANYTAGGLFLAAGIENPEGDDNYLMSFGAKYNFGGLVASAGYSTGMSKKDTDVSGWLVGARMPMGKADLKVGFASSKIEKSDGISKFAIGVDYNLSKRSKVYADFARYSGDAVEKVDEKNAFMVGIQHNF